MPIKEIIWKLRNVLLLSFSVVLFFVILSYFLDSLVQYSPFLLVLIAIVMIPTVLYMYYILNPLPKQTKRIKKITNFNGQKLKLTAKLETIPNAGSMDDCYYLEWIKIILELKNLDSKIIDTRKNEIPVLLDLDIKGSPVYVYLEKEISTNPELEVGIKDIKLALWKVKLRPRQSLKIEMNASFTT